MPKTKIPDTHVLTEEELIALLEHLVMATETGCIRWDQCQSGSTTTYSVTYSSSSRLEHISLIAEGYHQNQGLELRCIYTLESKIAVLDEGVPFNATLGYFNKLHKAITTSIQVDKRHAYNDDVDSIKEFLNIISQSK